MNAPMKFSRILRQMLETVLRYGRMIKFSHTIFALPFVLSAVVLAGRTHHAITAASVFWIMVAAVSARSAAMGFNRIADEAYDRVNPRTWEREIPSGRLSRTAAIWFVLLFSLVFIVAASMLGQLCLLFSVPVLLVLFGYSYTKRFTRWCHVYLGFAISLAPMGAWIAITNTFSTGILSLSLALLTYIAGFDIIYACQDTDFDRSQNLFSLPSRSGVRAALFLSSLLHVLSFGFFWGVYTLFDLGPVYLMSVLIIGALYVVEHWLVNPDDLEHIDVAFFHVNSVVSVLLFAGIAADEILRRWMS